MIGIGVSIVTMLIIIGNILTVGEKLGRIHRSIEYVFYVLSAILVYVLIINPVAVILFAPTFSVATVFDENQSKKYQTYKRVARRISKNKTIDQESKDKIKEAIGNEEELQIALNQFFNKTLKSEITKIIIKNAKTVMLSTAISQNGKLDMMSVLTVNLKMIKEIVLKCGFRPSYPKLGKLSLNVFTTAMIAEGLEGLDWNDIFPNTTTSFLSDLPLIKPIMSSVMQGISNALLTIRIGIVTRKYLFTEYKNISKDEVRKQSIKESLKLLPIVIKDVLMFFPSKVARLFVKKEKTPNNHESDATEQQ